MHVKQIKRLRASGDARTAFTLTELLIVIAIMAVLTGLIAAAAVNAMNKSRRAAITLEIKNVSAAIENFKNDFGAYPPNGMNPAPQNNPLSGSPAALVQADFQRMFKRAFQRSQEPAALILALCGQNTGGATGYNLQNGMTAPEALYFWLGGFSDDAQYPISGPGGPSFVQGDVEVLEDRIRRYEFNLEQLGPRDDDGTFTGRVLNYEVDFNNDGDADDAGEQRSINMWRYAPKGFEQPLVYFDVSRYKPYQYDVWAADASAGDVPYVFAMKQLRSGGTYPTNTDPNQPDSYQNNVVFVDQGKFQVLHPGPDDAWGEEFARMSMEESTDLGWGYATIDGGENQLILYPDGPFLGDIGDTLTSFTDGTLAEETEE